MITVRISPVRRAACDEMDVLAKRSERPAGNSLRSALDRMRGLVAAEVLHDALLGQKQRINEAERQQHVQGCARHVHPEVADGCRRTPAKADYKLCPLLGSVPVPIFFFKITPIVQITNSA